MLVSLISGNWGPDFSKGWEFLGDVFAELGTTTLANLAFKRTSDGTPIAKSLFIRVEALSDQC
jgi:hypothetical protein